MLCALKAFIKTICVCDTLFICIFELSLNVALFLLNVFICVKSLLQIIKIEESRVIIYHECPKEKLFGRYSDKIRDGPVM